MPRATVAQVARWEAQRIFKRSLWVESPARSLCGQIPAAQAQACLKQSRPPRRSAHWQEAQRIFMHPLWVMNNSAMMTTTLTQTLMVHV